MIFPNPHDYVPREKKSWGKHQRQTNAKKKTGEQTWSRQVTLCWPTTVAKRCSEGTRKLVKQCLDGGSPVSQHVLKVGERVKLRKKDTHFSIPEFC